MDPDVQYKLWLAQSMAPDATLTARISELERENVELRMEVNRLRTQLSHSQDLAPVQIYEASYSTMRPTDLLRSDEGHDLLWLQTWREGLQPQLATGALLLVQWFGFRTEPSGSPMHPTLIRARFGIVPVTIKRPDYEDLYKRWRAY